MKKMRKTLIRIEMDKRTERVYRLACSDIEIDVFDIAKVFEFGRKAQLTDALTDAQLGDKLRSFVRAL